VGVKLELESLSKENKGQDPSINGRTPLESKLLTGAGS
jgi:hypothetical protein